MLSTAVEFQILQNAHDFTYEVRFWYDYTSCTYN